MKDILFAIDNGTQSLRALAFDPQGNLLAKHRVPFEPYYSEHPGWAEQDPEVWWDALCTACRTLLENPEVAVDRVAGVSVTTQRGTVVCTDAEGRVLRPAILWLDQRKANDLMPLGGLWGAAFRATRLSPVIEHLRREAESTWISTYQPETWKATDKFLLLSGWLTHRLTGEFVDSAGCQVGYIPFDYKKLSWAAPWEWRWSALNISPSQMPRLVPPGKPLGKITRRAAEETGLPEGLPVIAAAADKACEVIGSGALDPSVGAVSYGTTATINVSTEKYFSPIPLLPPYPSAIPGRYAAEVQVYRGFWMVSWFKEQFGYEERLAAEAAGVEAETLFENMVDEVPPGSMGLMLQPLWTPGLKNPGPEGKGSIIGWGDVHTKAHLYRAILEGLAYALREGAERIQKKSKTPMEKLAVSGGGSQSDHAMQITADVFGLPAVRPHLYETSGLGAAMDLAVGLGIHPDFETAVAAMTRPGAVFTPDEKNHRLYDELYEDVYKKMYKRLKPLYKRIREITGYP
ncbi:MAG: FGGY-family carbohydrate kinase [Deltaproteobacteria bacterium]|nr:FGGY-family carbohydrate kinase [Deltaproteobacteria bacterium]